LSPILYSYFIFPTLQLYSIPTFYFFFFIIPPPPTSTLFPYTTLFRSHHLPDWLRGRAVHLASLLNAPLKPVREGQATLHSRTGLDRKSTRLNSSHSQISYAVFCLKKKKKKNKKNNK